VQSMMSQQGDSAVSSLVGGLRSVGWAMTGAIVIFFVGAYAAYEPRLYCNGLTKLFPKERRGRVSDVLQQLRDALGRWIVGRVMSMTLVGILTAIGLWFLDVPLPITLGVVAALLTFIPNIGPLMAAVPQVLLALNVGTETAIYVIVFNLALQGIESYLITPMIQRHEVTLPPILTIAAQLWMGIIVGVIGIMMAAPLVVVLMVLIQMLYIHDRLGDPNPGELTSD
ncbi:AI-2E family transporter, partial [Novipirellula sp.]|uniref:AI-2E family transporter n=1 Tax=Novipirellula sp. TaxID=2795430 RepID=UPI0035653B66